jgi:hypothetical protein
LGSFFAVFPGWLLARACFGDAVSLVRAFSACWKSMMNPETIREWLLRRPFDPFAIGLSNGENHLIRHPENLAIGRNRLAVVNPETDSIAHVALIHVNSVRPSQAA